eukprot:gb/GECH01010173.1/.p1 GENE.gb/GECH01010173.1/~~gb/GECH01010173.1/.p1  ORF type:complete len:173 (+),score=51.09 gb/GECH01010173.1/:1-519(+)
MFLYNALFGDDSQKQNKENLNDDTHDNNKTSNKNTNNFADNGEIEQEQEWSFVDREEFDSVQSNNSPDVHSISSLSSDWACIETEQNAQDQASASQSEESRSVVLTGPEIRALALRQQTAKAYQRDVLSVAANERRKKARMVHQRPSKQKFRKQPKNRRLSNVPKLTFQRKC